MRLERLDDVTPFASYCCVSKGVKKIEALKQRSEYAAVVCHGTSVLLFIYHAHHDGFLSLQALQVCRKGYAPAAFLYPRYWPARPPFLCVRPRVT